MHSYTKIIVPLNEINSITEALPQVEKRTILDERARTDTEAGDGSQNVDDDT